jgi:hypothetical protein
MFAWNAIRNRIRRINDRAEEERNTIEWPRIRITSSPRAHGTNRSTDEGGGGAGAGTPRRNVHRRRSSRETRASVNSTIDDSAMDESANTTMPLLYSLARSWAWEAVAFRCQTHPHEASAHIRDYLGDTCLHWTVFGRPPTRAVQAILAACPDTARTANDAGLYPLHVACSYRASAEVIQALIMAYPEAAILPTKSGVYPIHFLCDYGGSSVESVKALLNCLEGMHSVVMVDPRFQRRSLFIFNERKNLREQQEDTELVRDRRMMQRAILREFAQPSVNGWEELVGLHNELFSRFEDDIEPLHKSVFWRTVVLLVVAEYQHILTAQAGRDAADLQLPEHIINEDTANDVVQLKRRQSTILHAFVGNPECPPALQEHAVLLYEPHLLTQDDKGRCPLHLATETYALDWSEASSQLIMALLQACPTAASVRDTRGCLPLSLVLGKGHRAWNMEASTQGLDKLIDAYPLALFEPDIRLLHETSHAADDSGNYAITKSLYPHVFARLSRNGLYILLQANPTIVARSAELN